MDLSKTLFVLPPTDDKFLCTYHGGLMDIPIENNCSHCFCSFCIESLTCCPVDGCDISDTCVNNQLKDEIDQLLCYCQYGVEENPVTGEITTKINGCSCVISYGSKIAHESVCKYNPVNEKSPSLSYQDFYEMKMSGSGSLSNFSSPVDTSPKSSNSTSKSPSFEFMSSPDLNNNNTTSTNKFINNNNENNDYFDNNALWESSTSLFFCNRFCPNKDLGCCYTGKTEQDINYHLQIECYCQKMKEKIYDLEKMVEEQEQKIKQLKSSDSKLNVLENLSITNDQNNQETKNNNNNTNNNISNNTNNNSNSSSTNNKSYQHINDEDEKKSNNKQIQTYNFGKIFVLLFNVLKKGIKKSIKKVKKLFKRKNTGPYKNFIKIK
ncbi:hypothetical protein DICPUDRAFT_40215 [Dictyostelium purpureum]|uniref:RING-type domain-containing protein n=1 Tax=Dictyostelium purpureum TaxID=5786 RepID=F0ZXU5_DICPU|nr:uncharacterized protein DICPUDRAFT_40215 [Dictyostelium purpureum]EGC31233.1 hypothetical protein DICPUDRAFT_40215 [Dictyostelium purpureum]|eukprot:XP_003292236.1 hypothetical protein DICPUDRAFT_40215 [Dictyostelium purpureum]